MHHVLSGLAYFIFFLLMGTSWSASHHPQAFLKQIRGTKNEGMKIVEHFCVNCHAKKPIIPLGAPRIGVTDDWIPRLKDGLHLLVKHTEEGLNAMPARGGCFECSDQQLLLAILYMLPASEQRKINKKSIQKKQ